MKVILEAFCGNLKSEPMEFPDEIGNSIHLMMDMEHLVFKPEKDMMATDRVTHKRGKFESLMASVQLPNKQWARVYRLVDIS